MQFIDRAKLEQLAKMPDVVVEDDGVFSFSEFVAEWKAVMNEMKRHSKDRDEILEWTYKELKNGWLKQHKAAFAYIGEGSSRAAFAFPGGKCLKIAMNRAGIAQNKQEFKNIGKSKYSCFVQAYEFDKTTGCAMVTECCSKMVGRDFTKAFRMTPTALSECIETMFKDKGRGAFKNVQQLLTHYQAAYERARASKNSYWTSVYADVVKLAANAAESNAPQWNVIGDLISFYIKNGADALLAGDLEVLENWGLAVRQGAVVPVIIDAGFSEKVWSRYY